MGKKTIRNLLITGFIVVSAVGCSAKNDTSNANDTVVDRFGVSAIISAELKERAEKACYTNIEQVRPQLSVFKARVGQCEVVIYYYKDKRKYEVDHFNTGSYWGFRLGGLRDDLISASEAASLLMTGEIARDRKQSADNQSHLCDANKPYEVK